MQKQRRFNMSKIQGVDANIETSLMEYHLAWIVSDDEKEIRFWYAYRFEDDDLDKPRFDWIDFDTDMDVEKEFDWIDNWEKIIESTEMDNQEWLESELPYKIETLVSCYGFENIFGSTYTYGFKYLPNINRFEYLGYC